MVYTYALLILHAVARNLGKLEGSAKFHYRASFVCASYV